MKIKVILGLLFLLGFSMPVMGQKALIFCEKSSFDFGKIKEDGGLVTHTFVVKNIGKAPLVLNKAEASCGCTTPIWTKTPILPGKTGTIKVSFNPEGIHGSFAKTVKVFSNANQSGMTLIIRGFIEHSHEEEHLHGN